MRLWLSVSIFGIKSEAHFSLMALPAGWTAGDFDEVREIVRRLPISILRARVKQVPDEALKAMILGNQRALYAVAGKKAKLAVEMKVQARKKQKMSKDTAKFLKAAGWDEVDGIVAVIEHETETVDSDNETVETASMPQEQHKRATLTLTVTQAGVVRINMTREWRYDVDECGMDKGTRYDVSCARIEDGEITATDEDQPSRSEWTAAAIKFFRVHAKIFIGATTP